MSPLRLAVLALLSTLSLAACLSDPELDATSTSDSSTSESASSTGSGGAGGSSSASASDTSSESASDTSSESSSGAGGGGGAGGGDASCADVVAGELSTETSGLLYPSESDYPFEIVDVADPSGQGAITPAHLIALLGLDPQSKTEARTVDMLFASLLSGPDGAKYQVVLDTLKSRLTDLTVIRVVPPPPSSAQVHVYVVGRTPCGEVLGLMTISIET